MYFRRFRIRRSPACCVVVLVCMGIWLAGCVEKEHELILLHTNDSHGSILPVDSLGGMAERATFIRQVRDKYPGVLLVDAGDFNTGQAVSNMFDAFPDVEAYNYMEYDAVTLGNHEFDQPVTLLLQQMQRATFPFVVSNVEYSGKTFGTRYLVKEVNGVKVGLFGLTTKNTENISIYVREVVFHEEIKAAREMVEILKKQKAEVIIGLVHLGFVGNTPEFVTSLELAAQVPGIDILVDGHTHTYIEQPVKINDTWIVIANQSGRFVGEGHLKVARGRLTDFSWKPVKIKGFQPDSILLRRLEPYVAAADKDLQTVIGRADGRFALFEQGENRARYGETALGNLVADALKWKAGLLLLNVDFALINSGGIRTDLPAGDITKGAVLSVLPFNNELEIVAMKGREVRRLFDFVAAVFPGDGAFAVVSREVQVEYDREAKKVLSLFINGQPVEEERIYYVATCDYVAAGKDGYAVVFDSTTSREKTSCLLSAVVMEYIQMQGIISPQTDGRIQVAGDFR